MLYVVLPPLPGVDFWGFLGLFSVALLMGVASQVPGGLGVFESVVLIGLSGHAEGGAVLGSIIAYRAIYYLLPLILAGILLAGNELLWRKPYRMKQLRVLGGAGSRLVPPFMAALVFVAGVILLISGAAPESEWRLIILDGVVPLPVVELSHILGSLIGLALLVLARGLYRRLDSAWYVSVALLASAVVISLIKGLDYEEAIVVGTVLAILVPCRTEFYRRARIADLRITVGWLLAIGGVVGGVVWLTFFTTKHVEYSNDLWWQFAFYDNAPRSLRATFLSVIVLVLVSLNQLFRPTRVKPHLPTEVEMDAVRVDPARHGAAGSQSRLAARQGAAVQRRANRLHHVWGARAKLDRAGRSGRPGKRGAGTDLAVSRNVRPVGRPARLLSGGGGHAALLSRCRAHADQGRRGGAGSTFGEFLARSTGPQGFALRGSPIRTRRDGFLRCAARAGDRCVVAGIEAGVRRVAQDPQHVRETVLGRRVRFPLSAGIRYRGCQSKRARYGFRKCLEGGAGAAGQHRRHAVRPGDVALYDGILIHQAFDLGEGTRL